ncbi:ethanolamine ammonia-lyase reactivating factor EutA [Paenibacillus sp. UNC451MF]|uniref:ethanolamine ammonia-lyase reactivating factor EutA n=1 Tax=Paenibacillus sp. UNC451MF TaxID=1449063 RepID=UPI000561D360|nr:ethanolamine ammonia-lyase reactivating factor EutA [Paenibacillus sp. UNC451MF]
MDSRKDDPWITSVGIDIGTSTTKMIISRLRLARTSGSLSLPRYDIVERELLYASPIYSTPLKNADEVDAERIGELLVADYARAEVQPNELKSGAVIITGETANKANARQIVHLLAERSGDFVVATAGADLEGLLAGKGAGAERRSMQIRGAVANIDIGGGTANTAVFHRGKLAGTVTFHIGGRLIQVNNLGTITAISDSLRPWLEGKGYKLKAGQTVSYEQLQQICTAMCRDMLHMLCHSMDGSLEGTASRLLLGHPLGDVPAIEEWMISGGIGKLMTQPKPTTMDQIAIHGDIGPLLAHALQDWMDIAALQMIQAEETVRATVIGAGMQSTEISGATVHLDASLLPIRNMPVMKIDLTEDVVERPELLERAVVQVMRISSSLYEREEAINASVAFALPALKHWSYASLQNISTLIVEGYRRFFPASGVIIVICVNDVAKALGQSIARRCGDWPKVICIDQIRVEHGDYIDLGEPIGGIMIPVVVKTLAFHGGNRR